MMNSRPVHVQAWAAVLRFPAYALAYVAGFYIVLIEVEMTTVLLVAILAGLVAKSVLVGLLVFLSVWLLLRTLNGLAAPIGQAIIFHARAGQRPLPAPRPADTQLSASGEIEEPRPYPDTSDPSGW